MQNVWHFPPVSVGTEQRREGEGFKTCTLGIKISFQPAEARSLWSLPTGPAKNNYCQIESIVNCPQGELPWLERASKREF